MLEHASFTFAIEGISRVTTHQLVRHRIASFSQQSQRYVSHKEHFTSIMPDTIAGNPEARQIFASMSETVHKAYAQLIEMGIPAEDARYILPNATETKIIMTMNARELLHFFALRCCRRAQWEIREMSCRDAAAGEEGCPGHISRGRSWLRRRSLSRGAVLLRPDGRSPGIFQKLEVMVCPSRQPRVVTIRKECMEKINVGGQAVIEGVMMRAPRSVAIAVRRPNGEIVVSRNWWCRFPSVIRLSNSRLSAAPWRCSAP